MKIRMLSFKSWSIGLVALVEISFISGCKQGSSSSNMEEAETKEISDQLGYCFQMTRNLPSFSVEIYRSTVNNPGVKLVLRKADMSPTPVREEIEARGAFSTTTKSTLTFAGGGQLTLEPGADGDRMQGTLTWPGKTSSPAVLNCLAGAPPTANPDERGACHISCGGQEKGCVNNIRRGDCSTANRYKVFQSVPTCLGVSVWLDPGSSCS